MSRSRALTALAAALCFGATTALAAPKTSRRPARRVPRPAPRTQHPNTPVPQHPTPSTPETFAPVSLDQARLTVTLLDDAYQGFLEEIHRWYPVGTGQPIVAATVVRQMQERMNAKGYPPSRFLGVTGILMNQDHRPHDDFERRAVEALARGGDRFEEVIDGRLRVATSVPLTSGCTRCHWSDAGRVSKAAISWSIPLLQKALKDPGAPRARS